MPAYLDVLKNYAYHFYPKGIDNPFEEEYLSSEEYLTLIYAIDKAKEWDLKLVINALLSLEINFKYKNQKVSDLTNFSFGDRCFHIQYGFQDSNMIKAISVNISVLAPVFCVYYVKQNNLDTEFVGRRITHPQEFHPYDFLQMPEEFKSLKKMILELLTGFGYQYLPNEALSVVIPDISYETIGLNNMTVFNTFFMNEPYCEM